MFLSVIYEYNNDYLYIEIYTTHFKKFTTYTIYLELLIINIFKENSNQSLHCIIKLLYALLFSVTPVQLHNSFQFRCIGLFVKSNEAVHVTREREREHKNSASRRRIRGCSVRALHRKEVSYFSDSRICEENSQQRKAI